MKICFLDGIKIPYTSKDINSNKIRGAENILINLSLEFSNLNHDVTIYNNCNKNEVINNVTWKNINSIKNKPHYDLAISNNDIRLLDNVISNNKVAISHSIQSIEKFFRKKQFIPYLKNKPKIVTLGDYHDRNRNYLIKIFGSFKINWAVDQIFIDANIKLDNKSSNAIFTSHSDRNLNLLIDIWKKYIFPKNTKKKLLITPCGKNLEQFNIHNRKFEDKNNLLSDLSNSRVLLIPGHKAELFCISAEEARELCVPIVTLGIGCLNERVEHNKTGFIAKNSKEFANYANILLNDDIVWSNIRSNLYNLRGSNKWAMVAQKFLSRVFENDK
tara:strand:- start:775 stop:1764 length:990 start_codon:yes stop_codon:yes gene_type:complete